MRYITDDIIASGRLAGLVLGRYTTLRADYLRATNAAYEY